MPKFHAGQAVVCVEPDESNDLSIGRIYSVVKVLKAPPTCLDVSWAVAIDSRRVAYDEDCFAPVEELPAEALAELLEETLTPTVAV